MALTAHRGRGLATIAVLSAALLAAPAAGHTTSTTSSSTTTSKPASSSSSSSSTSTAAKAVPPTSLVFPVAAKARFTDTFGFPRQGGKRKHEGQDLIGAKMSPLVAVVDGTVTKVTVPQPSTGYGLVLTGTDGWIYRYIHINNDSVGTDDRKAPLHLVYGPGIAKGAKVKAGQLIAFLGDSGNAEGTVPHLHFEVRTPKDKAVNAYKALVAATYLEQPAGLPEGYVLPPLGTTKATPRPPTCTTKPAKTTATSTSTTTTAPKPTSTTVAGDSPDPTTTTTSIAANAASTSTSTTLKPCPAPAKKKSTPKKSPPKKKSTTTTARSKPKSTTTTTARRATTTTRSPTTPR